jgi:hypothetical protein
VLKRQELRQSLKLDFGVKNVPMGSDVFLRFLSRELLHEVFLIFGPKAHAADWGELVHWDYLRRVWRSHFKVTKSYIYLLFSFFLFSKYTSLYGLRSERALPNSFVGEHRLLERVKTMAFFTFPAFGPRTSVRSSTIRRALSRPFPKLHWNAFSSSRKH